MSSCRRRILPLATVVLAGVAAAGFGDASAETLAGFADSTAWRLLPSDGVEAAWVAPAPGAEAAVRFAFGGGGWFILRQDLDLPLPANWEFSFRVAGDAPPNNLEFKLVDPSGENVWWSVRRDFVFRREGETVRVKKRHVSFAWGPRGGGDVDRLGAIEIAVSAGAGGSGTLEFSDLRWRELPERTGPPSAPWATATSFAPDAAAALAVDGDPATAWRAAAGDPEGAITLAFPGGREFSALFLDWGAGADVAYRVDAFSAGVRTSIGIAETGPRGIHRYWCPESDADSLRISITSGVAALHEVELVAPEDVADRNAFFGLVASRAPRGTFPRSFSGEQSYWTIVGADGGENVALFGEDGELELAPGGFSVAPWIEIDGRRQDWSRASESAPTLADAGAPVPTVEQRFDDHTLRVTAIPGATDAEPTAVRLRVENQGRVRSRVRLGVAIRPFQVNPPTQFLAVHGGAARVRDLEIEAGVAIVDGTPRVAVLGAPDGAGVADFERGEILERVRAGALPACTRVRDPLEAASGAFVFDRSLAPGEVFEIGYLATAGDSVVVPEEARDNPVAWLADTERAAVDRWRDRVAHVRLELPEDATGLAATFRAQLAYVLVNRAGPAIRPGSRSYRRSWIRDGALTSSALLRAGEFDVPREFLRWYAPYQYEDGKIPCVVDWRGADPVPEHDSNGEFVFLVAEILRYTGDRALAEEMWSRVARAVDYLVALRSERTGPEYDAPDRAVFRGLMPPSISHEGYSAKPMHSYWDDFFALRGFRDAAWIARELGHVREAARCDSLAAAFARDLAASIELAGKIHDVDYVPGCADLGDFDPTSTTIALSPTGAEDVISEERLRATFDRYWDFFVRRRDGVEPWDAFTPYELRNVGAFVRLGEADRAWEVLTWMMEHRTPPGWRQWPEVVRSDPRRPGFLGDLPHTWCGSDFVRSMLDLFAYVDEDLGALRLGRGVPSAWRDAERTTAVRALPTPWGEISWELSDRGTTLRIEGEARPPGGILVDFPWLREPVVVSSLPTTVHLRASPTQAR